MNPKYCLWCCCTDMFEFFEGHTETLFENREDAIKYGIDYIQRNDYDTREIEPEPDGYYHIRHLCRIQEKDRENGCLELYAIIKECSGFKLMEFQDYKKTVDPDEDFMQTEPETKLRAIIEQKEVY